MERHFIPKNKWKKSYILIFETALILSLLILISLFNINFPERDPVSTIPKNEQEVTQSGFILTSSKPTPIPPPPPKVPVPIEKPEDKIIEEDINDFKIDFSIEKPLSLPAPEVKGDENNPYKVVDEMPELIGGISTLQNRINYPKEAIRDQIEGRVIIKFTINKNGHVLEPMILKGLRDDCDTEALKAVASSKFIPGRHKGKRVSVEYMIHVLFKLEYQS